MREKSIIIIGAGMAGLSAGCYAQMNGYKTQIFESHTIPGGLCTSWKRKGYMIDGCIHWLNGSRSGVVHRFYEELGAVQGRQMVDSEEFIRVEGEEERTLIVYTDLNRLENHLKELYPADTRIIEEFCGAGRLFARYEAPIQKPREMMGLLDMLKMLKMMPWLRAMRKYSKISIQDYASRFKDPFLRKAFPLVFEDMPDFPMSGMLLTLADLHKQNAGVPIGGSLKFALAVEKRYRGLGGKVHYRSRVEKILVENNRAVGVRLTDSSEHRADMIISAADGRTTIFNMLDGKYVNDKIRYYYERWRIHEPFIQISLGIARDLSKEPHKVILPFEKPIDVGDDIRNWATLRHYCYDPGMAPKGKSVVTVSFMGTKYEYWKKLYNDRERYDAAKQNLADTVIEQLEKRFTGIKGEVEMVDVATPVTYERYTGNWRGSYMGWASNTKTAGKAMKRTLPGLGSFYMAGQWIYMGGGVPGAVMSGRHLIQIICKQDKRQFITTVP